MPRTVRVKVSPYHEVCDLVERCRGFIFDLDGTIYLGSQLIPGADRTIALIRDSGCKVAFLSNKPIGRREDYVRKLNKLGIPCSPDEMVTSSLVLARYLSKTHPGARVFPIAEKPVIKDLRHHGLRICRDPNKIEVVVVSWDRGFNYRKLDIAYNAAMRGAALVGTNPDRTCPMPGHRLPDAACMIAAVEACTERKVDPIVGKPSEIMLQEVLDLLGLPAEECAVFGDRIETDMVMAHRAGLAGVLVLTGVTTDEDIEKLPFRPKLVLRSVADLIPALE